MYSEEMFKKMMDLFTNPLFKKSFYDFFLKMQMEGIESAKRFWSLQSEKNAFDFSPEIFEKLVDFYIILGFVPRFKYDELQAENKKLKEENTFLRNTIKELQVNIFREGGEKAQETWKAIVDQQFDMNKEIAKNFFDLFRSFSGQPVSSR